MWRVSRSCCFPAGATGCYKHLLRLLWQSESGAPRWCSYLCACNGRVAGFFFILLSKFSFPNPQNFFKKKKKKELWHLSSGRERLYYRVWDLNQHGED